MATGSLAVRNRLPDTATLGGTLRTFADADTPSPTLPAIRERLRETIVRVAEASGAQARLSWDPSVPPTINSGPLIERLRRGLGQRWPKLILGEQPRLMAAEDFAFYGARHPVAFVSLGIARDGLGRVDAHQAGFNLHPEALEIGVRFWLEAVASLSAAP